MVSAKSFSNIVRLVLNNMHELVAETHNRNYFIQTDLFTSVPQQVWKGHRQDKLRVPEKNEIKTLVIMITNNKENE